MPSASVTITLLAMSSLLAAAALVGCTSTQQTATWLHIRSERELDRRKAIDVKQADPGLHVVRSAVIRGAGGTAIAVDLRNQGSKPVNDLPLAVGVKTPRGETTYLNDQGHLPYFEAHAPALAPGQEGTWVYTTTRALPAGSAVARVGVAASPPTTASRVPELEITGVSTSEAKREKGKPPSPATVEAEIDNDTGMTQYDVAVYAWAEKGGRYVAAGGGTAGDLDAGEGTTVKLELVGDPDGAEVHVAAPPTIFQ